jgi:hypothetical protein
VSLIVVTLTNLLELTTQEGKAYTLLEKLDAKTDIQEEAGNMIGTVAKLKTLKSAESRLSTKKGKKMIEKLESQLEDQRKTFSLKRK